MERTSRSGQEWCACTHQRQSPFDWTSISCGHDPPARYPRQRRVALSRSCIASTACWNMIPRRRWLGEGEMEQINGRAARELHRLDTRFR